LQARRTYLMNLEIQIEVDDAVVSRCHFVRAWLPAKDVTHRSLAYLTSNGSLQLQVLILLHAFVPCARKKVELQGRTLPLCLLTHVEAPKFDAKLAPASARIKRREQSPLVAHAKVHPNSKRGTFVCLFGRPTRGRARAMSIFSTSAPETVAENKYTYPCCPLWCGDEAAAVAEEDWIQRHRNLYLARRCVARFNTSGAFRLELCMCAVSTRPLW
jgi:hypothetical protein